MLIKSSSDSILVDAGVTKSEPFFSAVSVNSPDTTGVKSGVGTTSAVSVSAALVLRADFREGGPVAACERATESLVAEWLSVIAASAAFLFLV
jgi:hypothetical protein